MQKIYVGIASGFAVMMIALVITTKSGQSFDLMETQLSGAPANPMGQNGKPVLYQSLWKEVESC